MHESELEQARDSIEISSARSPHGAESENSPLLPRNLGNQPVVERCKNPDIGSVHVHRHSQNTQRTKLQQRVDRSDFGSGNAGRSPRSIQKTVRQPQRYHQHQSTGSHNGSPRLAVGYQEIGTTTAVVHLQRNCRYIRKESVVEVRIRGQKICKVCSEGIPHTGNARKTPTQY